MPTLAWNQIHTVLLDMDGTLLDLHFDNYFWLEHVPKLLASQRDISLKQAKSLMDVEYESVQGTIHWYCLDYWSEKLNIDIVTAKREVQHLISMREDAVPFLDALKETGREVVLVTNAHPDSLSLKIERTELGEHIDKLISTHQFGVTKESQSLWQQLHKHLGFEPKHTLFVDDSLNILQAARTFGVGHLLAVANPDSQQAARKVEGFEYTTDFRLLVPDIRHHPR